MLAKESCGEPWLLQPKIRDMESLEYRSSSPHLPSFVKDCHKRACYSLLQTEVQTQVFQGEQKELRYCQSSSGCKFIGMAFVAQHEIGSCAPEPLGVTLVGWKGV